MMVNCTNKNKIIKVYKCTFNRRQTESATEEETISESEPEHEIILERGKTTEEETDNGNIESPETFQESPVIPDEISIDGDEESHDEEASDDDENQSNSTKKSIRPKSDVWTQFETKKDSSGKITSNKCLGCKRPVSAKADRMKKHISKCWMVKKPKTKRLQESAPATSFDAPASDSLVESDATRPSTMPSDIFRIPSKQGTLSNFAARIDSKKKKAIDLQLGRFLFSTDLSFNIVESEEFKKFVQVLNPAYKPPGRMTIGSTILDEVSEETGTEMGAHLKGANVSMIQDGWSTNQQQPVIAHCVTTIGKQYFIEAEGTGSEKKTHEYCYKLLNEAIKKAEKNYKCNVVGVVTDNCKSMQSLQELCRKQRPELFVYGCNAHLLNLIGKHFTPDDVKDKVITVQKFMRNHHFLSASLMEMGVNRPVLPGTTRWNSEIDSFLSYCKNQTKYLEVTRKYETNIQNAKKTDKEHLKQVMAILNSSSFYDSVRRIIAILKPVCLALDKVSC